MIRNKLFTKLCAQASINQFYRGICKCPVLNEPSRNDDNNKGNDSKMTKSKQMISKRYKIFNENEAEIIYDDQIDLDYILNLKQKKPKTIIHNDNVIYQRGKEGVFDIQELINLLQDHNLKDIATIKVPEKLKYCNYMVLCTATSFRHIKTFLELFNKVYKIKKSPNDPFLVLNNDQSKDWRLVDIGNIILHIFMKNTREYYDLETLWTVGEEFDDKIQRPESDLVKDIMDKHKSYLEHQLKNIVS